MKTTEEICHSIGTQEVLARLLPSNYCHSIPIPGIDRGTPMLTFFYFLAEGPLGRPKTIRAPAARVRVDTRTSHVVDIALAPAIWLPSHDAGTVLGYFPPRALAGLSVQAAEERYRQYYRLTDALLAQARSASELAASPIWPEWKAAFQGVYEDSLAPYFFAAGVPRDAFPADGTNSPAPANPSHVAVESRAASAARSAGDDRQSSPAAPPAAFSGGSNGSHASPGADTPEQTRHWIASLLALADRARTLFRNTEQTALREQCERISRMFDVPQFMVAVVGEFSRGKSTLINRLLGEAVLSEGDLPTTAMLTRVMTGDNAKLVHVLPDRSQQEIPFDRDALERFSADSHGRDPTGVLEIRLPHPWLKRNGIAFIDSPGANDPVGPRAALACEAIANCEATLIAISAISPLSLTEKNFIEEHVFSHKVPQVAVVITRLDQVAEKEREDVVRYVLDKLRSWKFPIEVWSAHGEPVLRTDLPLQAKGPEQMLSALERWVREPRRQRHRFAQIAAQLLDLVGVQRAALVARQELLKTEAAAGQQAIARARQLLENEQMTWEDLRLELERRCNSTQDWLHQSVADARPNLLERLRMELNRTNHPHDWWLKEMPYRLNQELRGLSRSMGAALSDRFKKDAAWLSEATRQAFSVQLAGKAQSPAMELGQDPSLPPREGLLDLDRYRMQTRIISVLAATGGFLLFGPLGGLVSAVGGIVAERSLSEKLQEQRDLLRTALDDGLHAVLQAAERAGRDNIQQAYAQLLEETKQRETTWQRTRLVAISADVPDLQLERSRISDTLGQVDALMRDIRTVSEELKR